MSASCQYEPIERTAGAITWHCAACGDRLTLPADMARPRRRCRRTAALSLAEAVACVHRSPGPVGAIDSRLCGSCRAAEPLYHCRLLGEPVTLRKVQAGSRGRPRDCAGCQRRQAPARL